MTADRSRITVCGLGPGGPGLLTQATAELLAAGAAKARAVAEPVMDRVRAAVQLL